MLFNRLKKHYYPGEDIIVEYIVEKAAGPTIVDGFLALYPADYKSATEWIVNKKADSRDGGIVKFPC